MTPVEVSADAALEAAHKELWAGKPAMALQLVVKVVEAGKVDDAVMTLLETLSTHPGLANGVVRVLQAVIQQRPSAALPCYTLARVLQRFGRASMAVDFLEEAVRRRPAYDEAHELLQTLRIQLARPHSDASVSVLLATTGAPVVRTAVRSVLAQDHPQVELMLVADGPTALQRLREQIPDLLADARIELFCLPYTVGDTTWSEQRVYAAMPALARGRFVAYLHEANAWAPDHLSRLVQLVATRRLQWASSLRVLTDPDGRVVASDDCDNVQPWDSSAGEPSNDASAYLLRTDIAVRAAQAWYARPTEEVPPPIAFCRHLHAHFPRTDTTGAYTLYARLEPSEAGEHRSLEEGRAETDRLEERGLPWRKAPPPSVGTRMPGADG